MRMQVQYDLVHQSAQGLRVADVVTNLSVPVVLPVYQHAQILGLQLEGSGARRLLEVSNRLPRFSLDEQWVESSVVHQATVRTDRQHYRLNSQGRERPPRAEDTLEVTYRCLAYWRPDSWHSVYALWLAHGQEKLMTFPSIRD